MTQEPNRLTINCLIAGKRSKTLRILLKEVWLLTAGFCCFSRAINKFIDRLLMSDRARVAFKE